MPNALRMWINFKIVYVHFGWTYSLALFRCIGSSQISLILYLQARWPRFWEVWNWDPRFRFVDNVEAPGSRWWVCYFFYHVGVPWRLLPSSKDVG